ncbi:MAG: hypothetical protein ACH349_07695 [Candidatus Rhabdochlamydia sp.]
MEGRKDQFSYLLSISDLGGDENVRIMTKGGRIRVLKSIVIFPIFSDFLAGIKDLADEKTLLISTQWAKERRIYEFSYKQKPYKIQKPGWAHKGAKFLDILNDVCPFVMYEERSYKPTEPTWFKMVQGPS